MKWVLGAILWAAPLLLPLHASARENRPNIVPTVCDDLGHGDVQSLNPERGKIKTPHIDNRASQGMATPPCERYAPSLWQKSKSGVSIS